MRQLLFLSLLVVSTLATRAASAEDSAEKNVNEGSAVTTPPTCENLQDTKEIFDSHTKKFKGCRVLSVKAGSAYDKLGMKTGDIVQPDSSRAKSMEEAIKMEQGR